MKILAVDCETDPFKHNRVPVPFVWGIYDGEYYREFTELNYVASYLQSQKAVAYAHNGGKFDWHFLLDYINKKEPLTVINGRLAKAKLGACELRDSFNIIPAPLSAYQKTDIEYWKFEKEHRERFKDEISAYLRDDCVFLWELVSQYREEYGDKLTQASSAMGIWQDMSDENERTDAFYYDEYKRYYYGGRTEAFEKGVIESPFKVYDIKSAYPDAMKNAKHPIGRPHRALDWGHDNTALVSFTAKSVGLLPFREENGSLSFPNDGEVRYFECTGWELNAYIDLSGEDYEIEECWRFSYLRDFAPYVDKFYALKAKAEKDEDKATRLFAKIFLNALYGKYASDPRNYSEVQAWPIDEVTPDGWRVSDAFENVKFIEQDLPESKHRFYNVATAASITGFVRAKLARVIWHSERPLYCDTDSIACVDFAGDILGADLGQWECEAECVRGAIGGKKMYAFEKTNGKYKIASKGAKLSEKEIFRVASGETVAYKNEAPTFSLKKPARFVERTIKRT
jgi:hypothetical protein